MMPLIMSCVCFGWFLPWTIAHISILAYVMSYKKSTNSTLHMAVARMQIAAAADNGDGKPLTNGIANEEVRI